MEDLYRDDGKDYLNIGPEEMIAEISIPHPKPHSGGSYKKLRGRKATDFAWASASVHITLNKGICEDIRIVLGSVGSSPIRVVKAEEAVKGKKVTDDLLEEAAELASKKAKPVANMVKVSPSYRKEMAGVMAMAAAREALARAQ